MWCVVWVDQSYQFVKIKAEKNNPLVHDNVVFGLEWFSFRVGLYTLFCCISRMAITHSWGYRRYY